MPKKAKALVAMAVKNLLEKPGRHAVGTVPGLALLESLPRFAGSELLFNGAKDGAPLSGSTLEKLMRTCGILEAPVAASLKNEGHSCKIGPTS